VYLLAQLMHRRPDHHLEDALIAATALVRGLTVVTRNRDDFEPFGVPLLNPFTSAAGTRKSV
jgi:toxin FitB